MDDKGVGVDVDDKGVGVGDESVGGQGKENRNAELYLLNIKTIEHR